MFTFSSCYLDPFPSFVFVFLKKTSCSFRDITIDLLQVQSCHRLRYTFAQLRILCSVSSEQYIAGREANSPPPLPPNHIQTIRAPLVPLRPISKSRSAESHIRERVALLGCQVMVMSSCTLSMSEAICTFKIYISHTANIHSQMGACKGVTV